MVVDRLKQRRGKTDAARSQPNQERRLLDEHTDSAGLHRQAPLPDDLKHFDEAAAVADRLASTSSLDEIRQRIKRPGELRAFVRQRQ